ncbi:MAG TPA: beta-hexosaminidase, partial [Rhizomicrobium sp.]|nr:beta-hexosaminidase [Rhizomicrobium sp.]
MPSRAIYGCAGASLSAAERDFFRQTQPWGFILFARNISNGRQVKALIEQLRETVNDPKAPVLIDQEGGRVARLRP